MGKIKIIDLTETEADVDWLRARRLKLRAEAGDKQAAEELRQMEQCKMKELKHDRATSK